MNAMNDNNATLPPLWRVHAVMPATVLVVAALTAIPACTGARHPVARTLRNELA
jgi:putative ABC transport system permease protein